MINYIFGFGIACILVLGMTRHFLRVVQMKRFALGAGMTYIGSGLPKYLSLKSTSLHDARVRLNRQRKTVGQPSARSINTSERNSLMAVIN
jgi:hypothetical protein